MKRVFATGLLAVFLLSAIASSSIVFELARIPSLLEHFRVHKQSDPGLTFFAYLHLHYSSRHADHFSQHDHSKLPLKGPRQNHSSLKLLALIPRFHESANIPLEDNYFFNFIDSPVSALLADIWQPPRLS